MEKVVDYNALKGGTLKRSIILLNQKLIKMLPEYFSQQQIGIIQHESFSEIVLRMDGQNMLENFISDLEKNCMSIFCTLQGRKTVRYTELLLTHLPWRMRCWSSIFPQLNTASWTR